MRSRLAVATMLVVLISGGCRGLMKGGAQAAERAAAEAAEVAARLEAERVAAAAAGKTAVHTHPNPTSTGSEPIHWEGLKEPAMKVGEEGGKLLLDTLSKRYGF